VTADALQTFKSNRSKINVTTGRNVAVVKRYEPRTDSLIDFKLHIGLVIKGGNSWRDVGRPQVAMKCIAIVTLASIVVIQVIVIIVMFVYIINQHIT